MKVNLLVIILTCCICSEVGSWSVQYPSNTTHCRQLNIRTPELEQTESYRMKRWTRYGNKVWNDTIRIGYANYLDNYERLEQDQVLKECTEMWTLPHYLEFEIIRPTADNKAHITISFEHFDTSIPGVKGSRTYGYSSPPQPHDADGVKIVFFPSFDLPLRKYDAPKGSFKLVLCHEIGHTLGLQDADQTNSIMYAHFGHSTAPDSKLDPDSLNGICNLYRKPLSHHRWQATRCSPPSQPTTRRPITRRPTTRRPTTRCPTTRRPTTRRPATRLPTRYRCNFNWVNRQWVPVYCYI